METNIISKKEIPELPDDIKIHFACVNKGYNISEEIQLKIISETVLNDILEKILNGTYQSLYLALNEDDWEEYFQLESTGGDGSIFFQIYNEETQTVWVCFDPDHLNSDEESSIKTSDGSVVLMRNTMKDRKLAAKCVEWYVRTGEPYPGMDWMKLTW